MLFFNVAPNHCQGCEGSLHLFLCCGHVSFTYCGQWIQNFESKFYQWKFNFDFLVDLWHNVNFQTYGQVAKNKKYSAKVSITDSRQE